MRNTINDIVKPSDIAKPELIPVLNDWVANKCKNVSPKTRQALHSDLRHYAQYCQAQGLPWLAADYRTLRQYVYEYRYQRSAGSLARCVFYVRQAHRAVSYDLSDPLVDTMLKDLRRVAKRAKRDTFYDDFRQFSDRLLDTFLGLYAKALLWCVYDSQFRITSLLGTRLEQLRVVRPSGIVWISWPEQPVCWEEDGGFLPPSTAEHLHRWFEAAGIVEGYLFPRVRKGRATATKATRHHALNLIHTAFAEAKIPVNEISFSSVREGALSDLKDADLGVYKIMHAVGLRRYSSVKALLHNSYRLLDNSSLELAKRQGRWGVPYGY